MKKTSDFHNKEVPEIVDELLAGAKLLSGQWDGARFEKIRLLQLDSRGSLGESIIATCLRQIGKEVTHNSVANRDEKDWDIFVVNDDVRLEVKTASLGTNARTFQHENLDKNRKFDGLVLLDLAPDAVFIHFRAHHDIPWRDLHRRRDSTLYKWDISLKKAQPYRVSDLSQFAAGYEEMLASIAAYRKKQKPEKDR